jgi:hypothetical protein
MCSNRAQEMLRGQLVLHKLSQGAIAENCLAHAGQIIAYIAIARVLPYLRTSLCTAVATPRETACCAITVVHA